ncbi:MAG TPA: hypothetical protein VHU17_20200, partial [Acidimicrobiales bacterium]|nr:hypothetical protein [Acidimicrobiales bacterium]
MSSEFHAADTLEEEGGRLGRASTNAVERLKAALATASHQVLEVTRIRDRMATPAGQTTNPEDLVEPRGLVLRPALLGFVALMAISIGASMPSSPFKL